MDDLDSLLHALLGGDDEHAEAALDHLASYGTQALPRLLPLATADLTDHRWWAMTALAMIDAPQARKALVEALDDSDPAVRQAAALGLHHNPTPEAVPVLIEMLDDRDRLLARLAGAALSALGSEAISPLTLALRAEEPAVRIEAARALASIDDPAVIPALFAALSDPSTLVVHWAEEGLNRSGVGMVFFKP
jgi:HEAT repeat protein